MPIQVFVQRLIAFSPSTISEEKREIMHDYSWKLRELNAANTNLEAAKNEVIIINLWATWCPPCVAEMPSFQALYEDYGDRVAFYFVSNEKSEIINRFMEKHNYTFPIYQALEEAPAKLNSNALPTTYVIDKKGEILIKKTGVADWNSRKLRELLDKLLSEEI
ncbi:MAG: TlpA family protein disulfide reductase [Flavobacteriaceae bacterium]|nr:TlpA family protein disulfide reductase [Flavobacteriaceae bacterium]